MRARIYVTLKEGVLDPQGQAIRGALSALGFDGVERVRQGKMIDVELADASPDENAGDPKARFSAMAEQLLANMVIEDYRVEIIE